MNKRKSRVRGKEPIFREMILNEMAPSTVLQPPSNSQRDIVLGEPDTEPTNESVVVSKNTSYSSEDAVHVAQTWIEKIMKDPNQAGKNLWGGVQ